MSSFRILDIVSPLSLQDTSELLTLQAMNDLLLVAFQIIVLIYSVVIHEVSHGLMANSMGDTTAKDLGRLSLNPLKHLDIFGSVILPLAMYLTTGFMFGYAKPVPYNPANLSDGKFGPAKVAVSGPIANICLALISGLTLRFLPDVFTSSLMPQLLSFIVLLNLVLAVFNLFPIPPLDGHWLLMTFLPARFAQVRVFLYRYSLPLLFLVILVIFPAITPLISLAFRLITGISTGF